MRRIFVKKEANIFQLQQIEFRFPNSFESFLRACSRIFFLFHPCRTFALQYIDSHAKNLLNEAIAHRTTISNFSSPKVINKFV